MSPEQASGEADLDGRSDIYSLGCVLYEILVGEPPFTGPSAQAIMARHAVEPLPRVRTVRVTVPDYVEAAIDKALAKVPADRFATGTEFAEALTTPAMPAASTVLPETRSRISPALVLGLVLVFGMGLGVVGASTAGEAGFSLFGYTGAWATVMAGVWFLFEKAEETVSHGTRVAVARWLEGLDPARAAQTWPETFAATFDRIFGERHFSWKCFRRSCVASLAAVVVLALVWATLDPAGVGAQARLDATGVLESLGLGVLFVAIVNLIPDYLSLLETRWALSRMNVTGAIGVFLALDLVATAFIASSGWVLLLSATPAGLSLQGFVRLMEYLLTFAYVGFDPETGVPFPPLSIWFYSTFFTSVWVWLYAVAGVAIRLGGRVGAWLDPLKSVMDVRDKPFRSMGLAAMVIVTVVFLAALPFAAL